MIFVKFFEIKAFLLEVETIVLSLFKAEMHETCNRNEATIGLHNRSRNRNVVKLGISVRNKSEVLNY